MESKPGPRLALLAGTRTSTERPGGTRLTRSALQPERLGSRERIDRHPGGDDVSPVGRAQRPLRVLEAVAGHGADDAGTGRNEAGLVAREQAGDRRRRPGLDEDALLGGEVTVRVEDLLVGH